VADGPPDDHRERELKFEVPDGWQLPDPVELAGAEGSVVHVVVRLESTYFDTVDGDLLQQRITLRRRTGDTDSGWQLKVPDGDARTEIRLPLGGRGVPEAMRSMTVGVRAGAALRPVATLRTARAVHRLVDADGRAMAELAVDDVTATVLGESAIVRTWREVEVELVDGDERVLARAAKWLRRSGARPAASASKLARALGVEPTPSPGTRGLAGLIRHYL
jgi:inorganic triphosphatase YgiF